jgi:hypothetical protein
MDMTRYRGDNQTMLFNGTRILLFRDRMFAKARNEYRRRGELESRVYMFWKDASGNRFFRFRNIPGTPVREEEFPVCEESETRWVVEQEMERFGNEGYVFVCVYRMKAIYKSDELEYVHTSLKVGGELEEVESELYRVERSLIVTFPDGEVVAYPADFELVEW